MKAKKILIVDDDRSLTESLKGSFESEKFAVKVAGDGESAISIAAEFRPDLVVLDIDLPIEMIKTGTRMDGLSVLRLLRQQSDVPVLMLTSTMLDSMKVVALEMGADDYLTKPFNERELLARVRAILRRVKDDDAGESILEFDELRIDQGARKVWKQGTVVPLTPVEYELLLLLARRPGQAFSRERLLERAWKHDHIGSDRVVDTHILNLRQKIEDDPSAPRWVVTVRGLGYRFEPKSS